jgi:hypothetical protein
VKNFRSELLEPPQKFYSRELGNLSRSSRSGWASAPCPFHHHESRGRKKSTAFGVRLDTGGFKCLRCDAHGGGILDFIMLRDGLTFKDAAIKLGAWDAAPSPEIIRKIEAATREREKKKLAEEQTKVKHHSDLIATRDQLHLAIAFQRECESRLDELNAGADPLTADESETCWTIISLGLDYERRCALEYRALAGLEHTYGE